jgi:hypothetical protein
MADLAAVMLQAFAQATFLCGGLYHPKRKLAILRDICADEDQLPHQVMKSHRRACQTRRFAAS